MKCKHNSMFLGAAAMVLAGAVADVRGGTTVHASPPMPGGGTPRQSQLWIDPSGENDSDNDAICWAPFTLAEASTVTGLRWWGDGVPTVGFRIAFFNQDPNTIASQPDIFGANSEPIFEMDIAPPTPSLSGGLYEYSVSLPVELTFQSDTRYFVSVVALQSAWYAPWGWSQGQLTGSTFWWQRGAHMYFNIAGSRAFELIGAPLTPTCQGDISGPGGAPDGAVDVDDLNALLGAWNQSVGQGDPRDLANDDGFIDVDDLNILLGHFGCV